LFLYCDSLHFSAWQYDAYHSTFTTITKRIGAITGLDMETAEGLQVVNYGIGGQYEPHFDMSLVRVQLIITLTSRCAADPFFSSSGVLLSLSRS